MSVPVFKIIYPSEAHKSLFKIVKASSVSSPDLKKIDRSHSNITKCSGFMEMRDYGIIVRSCTSFCFKINSSGEYTMEYPSGSFQPDVVIHDTSQCSPFYDGYIPLKVSIPLSIREDTGVRCMYTGATTHNSKLYPDMHVPTGVISFKGNSGAHVFLMVRIPESGEKKYKVESGDPLLQIIPLCESYELEHVVDPFWVDLNSLTRPFDKSQVKHTEKIVDYGKE